MKLLLTATLVALLFEAQAQAATIATIQNNAGGAINLTDEKCDAPGTGLFVYTNSAIGEISMAGCWTFDGSSVIVAWNDGTFYSYPAASARMVLQPKPQGTSL